MKNIVSKVGAWFKKASQVVKNFEDAMDYRPEDYLRDRVKLLEQRVTNLEGTPRK